MLGHMISKITTLASTNSDLGDLNSNKPRLARLEDEWILHSKHKGPNPKLSCDKNIVYCNQDLDEIQRPSKATLKWTLVTGELMFRASKVNIQCTMDITSMLYDMAKPRDTIITFNKRE